MPTLEVQLAKAQKDMDTLVKSGVTLEWWKDGFDMNKRDAYRKTHDGLTQRIRYLQQRIAVRTERNERAEQRAAAQTLMRLAEQWVETYEAHTSVPTVPE